MSYFPLDSFSENFLVKASVMHLNSRLDIPYQGQALVTRSELLEEAIITLADGRMTTNWHLHTLLADSSVLGKTIGLLTQVELKQLLLDVFNYVVKHCHPFCENCHGRNNVRK